MDDALDLGDAENVLDDDFMLQVLGGSGDAGNLDDQLSDDQLSDSDTAVADFSDGGGSAPSAVQSHFTEYSMTSEGLPRTAALQEHDARFEAFFVAQYDESQIGALDDEEEAADGAADPAAYEQVFDDHIAATAAQTWVPLGDTAASDDEEGDHVDVTLRAAEALAVAAVAGDTSGDAGVSDPVRDMRVSFEYAHPKR